MNNITAPTHRGPAQISARTPRSFTFVNEFGERTLAEHDEAACLAMAKAQTS